MEKTIKSRANNWLSDEYDQETRNEVQRLISEDNSELTDAFYKDLEFGTGGLRGIMGVGTNRINKYTIAFATQGLANYLTTQFPAQIIKVAIAFDSRNNSSYFSQIAADVLTANGIHCYLFSELRPTPELSFSVRHWQCQAGIMITASHNPREYNGYKVYWNDGGQLVPPHDKNIIHEVNRIDSAEKVKWERNISLIHMIEKETDEAYLHAVRSLSLTPSNNQKHKDLRIVFTPLHGTGITMIPPALKLYGFENVSIVESQAIPDGHFPTVPYPNPEDPEALRLAIEQANIIKADLVLATDPDADRVGVGVRNKKGDLILLNGNEIAALLTYYILSQWKSQDKIKDNDFIVKTIVTTGLLSEIADDFGVKYFNVLTGFKYIAETIRKNEGIGTFICGGEESYGFLSGDFVRDKDAVSTCCLIAELTAFMAEEGKTLPDLLQELYQKYSFYKEVQISITKKGKSGAEEITYMMENFRINPPHEIASSRVKEIIDFKSGKKLLTSNCEVSDTGLPSSDVLQFLTEDDSLITIRPSGTEPKIKFYIAVKGKAEKNIPDEIERSLLEKIEKIKKSLKLT